MKRLMCKKKACGSLRNCDSRISLDINTEIRYVKRKFNESPSEATGNKMSKKHTYNVETKNIFSMLTDEAKEDDDNLEMETEDESKKEDNTQGEGKKKKISPLLHGKVNDHAD